MLIRALDRKLLRDLRHMWTQVLAIGLVMASGIATFVMALSNVHSMERMQQTYYEQYRFAEVFARTTRTPNRIAEQMREIPGVRQVQTRTIVDATMDVPGLVEPAIARLISIPDHEPLTLNRLHLRQGRWIQPHVRGEVLANQAFMDAHGFQPGDQVHAVINERLRTLTIVGTVLSPEYVIQAREGDLLPDQERFGVFWMSATELEAMYDMEGAFNSVAVTLMPGALVEEVIHRLDLVLERYGGTGAYDREDHLPHRYLSDDIQQLRVMAIVIPSIFLGVASFLINAVLSRLIQTQREQIAALRAFGYTKWEVAWHYFKFTLVIAVIGAAVGTAIGAWMGSGLVRLYTDEFYLFPEPTYRLPLGIVLLAIAVSAGAGVLGVARAVQRALQLPPAEAMRPEPPTSFKPTVLERMGFQRWLPQAARMILRELERRPVRSAMSCLGIALATAVLVTGRFSFDAMDYLMNFQFDLTQRQQVTMTFTETREGRTLYELQRFPGVHHVEGFRAVPARLRHEHRSRLVAIMGLEPQPELFRLLDEDERVVDVPPHGLLLSQLLADRLGVRAGDTLRVEVMEGKQPTRGVLVAGTINDFLGLNAYMSRPALNAMMREDRHVSGAYLSVDRAALARFYDRVHETPTIDGVVAREVMLENFHETMVEYIGIMQGFIIGFAVVIAFGVVYNTVRISLAERSRELATLRVLGFTRGEISAILLGELAVLTVMAIPVGLAIGYGFAWLSALGLQTEAYRIPLVLTRWTFGYATVVILIASTLSGLVVRRRLDRLDLVSVLKARE